MARARKQSDEIYNARRRAKRRVASLEKKLAKGLPPQQAREAREQIANLQSDIARTYATKGARESAADKARRASVAASLQRSVTKQRAREERGLVRNERANAAFMAEMNRASKGDIDTQFGASGAARVKVFWTMTREMYAQARNADRAQLIMDRLGVSTMAEAFNRVMTTPAAAAAVQRQERLAGYYRAEAAFGFATDEFDEAAAEDLIEGEEEYVTSPIYEV